MDKHEYRLKTEQMTNYLQKRSYAKAREIADTIDWGKVKNVSTLCAVSEIYEYCGEYQKSRDILFLAYDRSPESKKIVYRLGTLALQLGQVKEASDCYDEFVALAPKDPNRFIFKYKLLKSKGAPLKEQIEALEEFKKVEYIEKWAFELAKLYKEAGMIQECLDECEDLILWFNDGKYIYKAMELKMQYKPLTPLQQEKYMERFKTESKKEREEAESGDEYGAGGNKSRPSQEEIVNEATSGEAAREAAPETIREETRHEWESAGIPTEDVSGNVNADDTRMGVPEARYISEPGARADEPEVEGQAASGAEVTEPESASGEDAGEAMDKSRLAPGIAAMVQEWQEEQEENAQIIRTKIEEAEKEKADREAREAKEKEKAGNDQADDDKEILSDDVRKLMEELEEESDNIDAWKAGDVRIEFKSAASAGAVGNTTPAASTGQVANVEKASGEKKESGNLDDTRTLLRRAMESLSASGGHPKAEQKATENETGNNVEGPTGETGDAQTREQANPETIGAAEVYTKEEDEIKLGDTSSMALAAKALENAVRVNDTAREERPVTDITHAAGAEENKTPYDTQYVVQGKYDLDSRSEVGIKAGLTQEQKKLFSYFVPVHGMSEQIVKVLQEDAACKTRYGTSKTGNLIIIGRKGSGKTVLAVNMVKAIQRTRKQKPGKVAIVKAESLNKREIAPILEKLHGGAIIIERASRMQRATIDILGSLMEGQTGELMVILEDERKPLERLCAEFPEFAKRFTLRIELPVFINDELVTFGQTYAKENGYKIDEMGILALYSDIDILQREERIVTVSDVKELVDDAIANSQRMTIRNIIKKILRKNRDASGRIILKEEDFK